VSRSASNVPNAAQREYRSLVSRHQAGLGRKENKRAAPKSSAGTRIISYFSDTCGLEIDTSLPGLMDFQALSDYIGFEEKPLAARPRTAPSSHFTADIIRSVAARHNIAVLISDRDRWAGEITRLSGDDVLFDDVENLVVALQRAGILSRIQAVKLQARYLRESRP
jgi:hypothetical protein